MVVPWRHGWLLGSLIVKQWFKNEKNVLVTLLVEVDLNFLSFS